MDQSHQDDESQDKTRLTAGGTPVAGLASTGEFKPGDKVGGDYEVLSFIGAGGMGHVYRVRHTIMQSEYALKTLSADKVTEVAWQRFKMEAQAIARMSHPNVVGIYNFGLHEGRLPYYVMDLIDGTPLSDRLRDHGPMKIEQAIAVFLEVCAGVGYAHKKGIVHRDIKPANIVILKAPTPGGPKIKIVDFGIAKLSYSKELAGQQLTNVGEVCGSPYYMSPEQCAAGKIDARSDIYSLGCTLFETLTGILPLRGRNAVETMMLHATAKPPTLQAASGGRQFPQRLEHVVAQTLAKEKVDRYQNVDQLSQDLAAVLNDEAAPAEDPSSLSRARQNPIVIMGAVTALLLAVAGGVIYYASTRPKQTTEAVVADSKVVTTPVKDRIETYDMTFTTPQAVQNTADNFDPKEPVTKVFVKNGKQFLHFTLPSNMYFGMIHVQGVKDGKLARGEFDLPAAPLCFEPMDGGLAHPSCLRQFGPYFLNTLILDENKTSIKIDGNVFKNLVGLKGLNRLYLKRLSEINPKVLQYIGQIPDLHFISIDACDVKMSDLVAAPVLMHVEGFEIRSHLESIKPLLQVLKKSKKLMQLELQGAKLDDDDYHTLTEFQHLNVLNISETNVSNRQLKILAEKLRLQVLIATDNHLTPACIPDLQKMMLGGGGAWLNLKTPTITPEQWERYRKALPGVLVN